VRVRVPLILRSMQATSGGDVRYSVRPIGRTGAQALTAVTLLIDNASVVFNDYEPSINATDFPATVVVDVGTDLTIPPGTTFSVQCPVVLNYRTLTIGAGASLVLAGGFNLTMYVESVSPLGAPFPAMLNPSATTGVTNSFVTPEQAGATEWNFIVAPGNGQAIRLNPQGKVTMETVSLDCA
jgi:hypothetical protein